MKNVRLLAGGWPRQANRRDQQGQPRHDWQIRNFAAWETFIPSLPFP